MKTIIHENRAWLVLEECGGQTLLVAKDIIEKRPYNAGCFCCAWGDSTLCGYLGSGRFLLSIKEANQYFPDNADRAA